MPEIYRAAAPTYLQRGFAPLPLPVGKKATPPDGWTGYDGRWPQVGDVLGWIGSRPDDANIALRLPPEVIGLDIDQHPAEGKFGGQTLAQLEATLGPLPATWRSSGRGGETDDARISGIRLYRIPAIDVHRLHDPGPHIEVIHHGWRYMVAPPSLHPKTGLHYRWYAPDGSATGPLAHQLPPLPPAWVEHLASAPERPVAVADGISFADLPPERQANVESWATAALGGIRRDLEEAQRWPEGHRDSFGRGWEKLTADSFFRASRILLAVVGHTAVSELQWREALLQAAPRSDSWNRHDIEAKWASQQSAAARKGAASLADVGGGTRVDDSDMFIPADPSTPAPAPIRRKHAWNDFGNADRIIERHGHRMRWVPAGGGPGSWTVFEGGRWVRDGREDGLSAADSVLRYALWEEADLYDTRPGSGPRSSDKTPTSERDDFKHWAATQQYARKVTDAVKAVSHRPEMRALASEFDRPPMLLNVANGVIDLATGTLKQHDAALLLTQQSPVAYDPAAKAPLWEQFLQTSMPDPGMREYLQRVVGYSLTADTSEQVFFIHHGTTKNGKSVFLDIMESILGSYAQTVPQGVLTATKGDQHSTGVARMEGRRFLQLSETRRGDHLDEQLIKRLSGGDTVAARLMRENDREFKIVGKFHLATNHLPHIEHDEATMRRLRLIHWRVQITEEQRDSHLTAKIRATELPGVLAWAVEGAVRWGRERLAPPVEAQMDTEAYIADQDIFARWMGEVQIVSKDGAFLAAADMYVNYAAWAERGRLKPMSIIEFGRELGRRGFSRIQLTTGDRKKGWQVQWSPPAFSI